MPQEVQPIDVPLLALALDRDAFSKLGRTLGGEQVRRGERLVGLEVALPAAGAVHPGPAHRHPAPTERDGGVLVAVPVDGPIGVVLALRPGRLGHLGLHELGHHVEADGDRGRQEALVHALGEQHQLLAHLAGQPLGQLPTTAGSSRSMRPTPGRMVRRGFFSPSFDRILFVAVDRAFV